MDDPIPPPSKQPKRFFDIALPKDFKPSASSRPLVVSNRPEQTDPMVTVTTPSSVEQPGPAAVAMHREPDLVMSRPTAAPTSSVEIQPSANTAESMMQEEYDEIEHELPAGNSPNAPISATEAAPAAAVTSQLSPSELAQAIAPKTEQPVVDTAAPTSSVVVVHHRKSNSLLKDCIVALVVLALLLVVADVLLDARVLKPTQNFPHTHFINK